MDGEMRRWRRYAARGGRPTARRPGKGKSETEKEKRKVEGDRERTRTDGRVKVRGWRDLLRERDYGT